MASPLLPPEELAALEGIVLLDARPASDFAEGHLHGAQHADLERQLSRAAAQNFDPAKGGRHPLPSLQDWRRTLGAWGISPDTAVVVYDGQGGANAAARAWWMLRAVGHEEVWVLDGGWKAACEAGLPSTKETQAPAPAPPYPASAWLLPTVDIDVVEPLARHPKWRVVDVRASERYRGDSESLDPVAGHIPGAANLPFTENLDSSGRFKSPVELRALYSQLLGGLRPDHLVVHCGSGVTACHSLLAMEHAGLTGGVLYVGSWSEWCRSGKPMATGEEA